MINLTSRLYLTFDNNLFATRDMSRLIVTERRFENEYLSQELADEDYRRETGIVGRYFNEKSLLEDYGSWSNVITTFLVSKEKNILILQHDILIKVLCSYWKTIFKEITAVNSYWLYRFLVYNENLLLASETIGVFNIKSKENSEVEFVEPVTLGSFETIFNEALPYSENTIFSTKEIPSEYLLMGYLSNTLSTDKISILKDKIYRIAYSNAVNSIDGERDHFFKYNSRHLIDSNNLLTEGISDPLEKLRSSSELEWLFDSKLNQSNYDYVLANYPPEKLLKISRVFYKFFSDRDDLLKEFQPGEEDDFFLNDGYLTFLIDNNIDGLIKYDIYRRKNGSLFSGKEYIHKTNSLLIAAIYKITREKKESYFTNFILK